MLDNNLFDDGYVSIQEAAQRLGISQKRVLELVQLRVLKARHDGWGLTVQPALIRGVTACVSWTG